MASRTFNIPKSKGTPRAATEDAIDIAARYFVYKVYEATDGQRTQWRVLYGMGESAATISRAAERGWVILQGEVGKPRERSAALTDEGTHPLQGLSLSERARFAARESNQLADGQSLPRPPDEGVAA
jgi:hypothetical protein